MPNAKINRRGRGQLGLDLRVKPRGRGGWRPGAGRKAQPGRRAAPHRSRPQHKARHPVHVTMRVVPGLPSLRAHPRSRAASDALRAGAERDDFRIVEYSIQANHLHCICEADNERSLANGVRAVAIRIARAVNRVEGRRGRLFAERYHARALTSPRAVRNCLVYVLHNHRRHAKQAGRPIDASRVDALSSASWFAGFSSQPQQRLIGRRPVPEATVWLLRVGWLEHTRRIHPGEVPRAPS